jgi:hypothetical protein
MTPEMDFDCFKNTLGTKASIPPPSIEKCLAKNTVTGIKDYGGRRAREHLVSAEGEAEWLSC